MNTQDILQSILAVQTALLDHEPDIEALDRAIGDGDHFINVRRGCEVMVELSPSLVNMTPADALNSIGMKLLSTIGGASGPLISSFFLSMSKSLKGIEQPNRTNFAAAFSAGVEAIKSRGKADLGEKTMLDTLIPVSRLLIRLNEADASLIDLCNAAKEEATQGMLATRDMIATKGRAHFLGDRAIGHIDPGSKTCEVAIHAVCDLMINR
jgi:dihydroxyacetone kinase-like protein